MVPDENIRIHKYATVRCDRCPYATKKQIGGGILIALNKSISSYTVKKKICDVFKCLDIIITRNNHNIYISVLCIFQNNYH